jgi:hypothetical protein
LLGAVKRSGIEGWLKVEVVAALGKKVVKLQNKGPDIILADDTKLELKAATDCNECGIRAGVTKYKCPCLFLAGGSSLSTTRQVETVATFSFSDGQNNWIIGLLRPFVTSAADIR